jgi:hypothetical protein
VELKLDQEAADERDFVTPIYRCQREKKWLLDPRETTLRSPRASAAHCSNYFFSSGFFSSGFLPSGFFSGCGVSTSVTLIGSSGLAPGSTL